MRFPNQLSEPKPLRLLLTGAGARLVLLLILCLAPRIWMAQRLNGVCSDGAFHLDKAQQIEQRLRRAPQDAYDFNVYPLLLGVWHHAGLEWETAAKVWGVLAGSLVVLPLFGWLRRMFDDRVALLGCALYAVHPKFVEWAPEALRDPTFWLLFTTSLYCSWRGVTEVRPAWFVAAGVATFLAVNTRFEGWLLVLPPLGWSLWRWLALRRARWQLAGGLSLFAACYPLVLAALVYLHGYERWNWGSFHRLDLVIQWAQASLDSLMTPKAAVPEPCQEPGKSAAVTPAAADVSAGGRPGSANAAAGEVQVARFSAVGPDGSARPPTVVAEATASTHPITRAQPVAHTAWIVMEKIGRAFTLTFGGLVLIGLLRGWPILLRRDQQPLVLLVLATLAAVWVHAAEACLSSTRYVLPLVILSTPLAALGLLALCRAAARVAAWLAPRARVAPYAAASLVFVLLLLGACGDALTSRVNSRTAQADLGGWLVERLGPQATISGPFNCRLTSMHAQARFLSFPYFFEDVTEQWFSQMLDSSRPDAVLLCHRMLPEGIAPTLAQRATSAGFEQVEPDRLPQSCRHQVTVLLRKPPVHVADRRRE
jgi:4-amino-4-deoxy-L-arabinose transferase-like glycosyltransferase